MQIHNFFNQNKHPDIKSGKFFEMENGFSSCHFLLFCPFISILCFSSYKSFMGKKMRTKSSRGAHLSYALDRLNYLPGRLRACSCCACHPSRKNKLGFNGKRCSQAVRLQTTWRSPSASATLWKVQTAGVLSGTNLTELPPIMEKPECLHLQILAIFLHFIYTAVPFRPFQ